MQGAGGIARELDELATAIRDAAGGRRRVVLIDGRSGAGKTVLAEALAPRLDAQLVSLDDLYPGWEGLEAGSEAVHETVLRARDPGWTRWDWTSSRPAEWDPLDPDRALVIEGCGALSRTPRDLRHLDRIRRRGTPSAFSGARRRAVRRVLAGLGGSGRPVHRP